MSRPRTLPTPRPSHTVELAAYGRMVRHHHRPAILIGLLGLAIGLGLTMLTPPDFRATAEVYAPAAHTKVSVDLEDEVVYSAREFRAAMQTQDTDVALLESTETLTLAKQELDGRFDIDELRERITVAVPSNTRVLQISFDADDPEVAAWGAQAVAESFATVRNDLTNGRSDRYGSALWTQRDRLLDLLEAAETGADTLPNESARQAVAAARGFALRQQLNLLDIGLAEVTTTRRLTQVVEAARPPKRRPSTNTEVPPISGLAVGVVSGLGVGVLRAQRRRPINERRDVLDETGVPVVELSNLAVELRVSDARRVLVAGDVDPVVVDTVSAALRTALDRGGALRCQVATSHSTVSGDTVRAAMTADLVLLVVERERSTARELRRVLGLLRSSRTEAELAVFLAREGTS